ncbi:MAG: hemolysin III family protein [Firmicutes bacterium]|nr:hemolysin III family protein [Bacillota bacterium]
MSLVGLILMLVNSISNGSAGYIISALIFGISLILLYTASTTYHLAYVSSKVKKILRRIDHMMIYVLIAGTYTPICLIALKGVWGVSLLTSIWILAIIGMILKLVWFNAPRWLYTAFYIAMGWLVIIAFYPLAQAVETKGLLWLIIGGITYSIGGIIYGLKRPKLNNNWFSFHEIFHIFVLIGSFCHFWFIYNFIM